MIWYGISVLWNQQWQTTKSSNYTTQNLRSSETAYIHKIAEVFILEKITITYSELQEYHSAHTTSTLTLTICSRALPLLFILNCWTYLQKNKHYIFIVKTELETLNGKIGFFARVAYWACLEQTLEH